jgi:hypothetical protein
MSHLPGVGSIEKLVRAIESKTGGSGDAGGQVRAAAKRFEQMVKTHLGDRGSLDLVVDYAACDEVDKLELSRRLAFRGNSGIYGVQARTRLQCSFLAPNPGDPSRIDAANVSGYAGFRRLRPSVEWLLFHWTRYDDAPDARLTQCGEPIEISPGSSSATAIMGRFTRGAPPEIRERATPTGVDSILMPGPLGNTGAFDIFRGEFFRAAFSRFRPRPGEEETGGCNAAITTPVQHLLFDMIVHRDLEFMLKPKVQVFMHLFSDGERFGTAVNPSLLPGRREAVEIAGVPPAVATPLVPRYTEIVQAVADRLGWDLSQFRGVRFTMEYPPLGATVLQRFPLPDPPGQ